MTVTSTKARAAGHGPPAGELWPGDVVDDRYAVEREVGRGGMGVVYLAKDLSAKRLCALKEICGALADNPDVSERFQTEAKVLAQLDHPCIVSLYGTGTHKGRPYLTMEWIDGRTLRDVMRARRKPFDLVEALDVAIQIGSALMVAHSRGVIHRDLKPENVMLRKRAPLKVLDWGLAKLRDGAATTNRLQVMVTPLYAAPEQLCRGGIDGRTDVYPLGLIFVEMATGRYAFTDPGETLPSDQIAGEMHRQAVPNRLIDWVPSCSETLSALVDRALSKDRRDRPDAAELVAGLVREARALGALPEEEGEGDREDEGARRDTRELPPSFQADDPLARFQRAAATGPRGTMKMESASSLLARQGRTIEQAQAEAQGESRARPTSLPPPPASGTRPAGPKGAPPAPVAMAPLVTAPLPGSPEPDDHEIPRPSLEAVIPRPSIEHGHLVYAAARAQVPRPRSRRIRIRTRTAVVLGALAGLFVVLGLVLWATARWVQPSTATPAAAASAAPSAISTATRRPSDVQ